MSSSGLLYIGIALIVIGIVPLGMVEYYDWTFEIGCKGHLKRAADANTVDLAKKELQAALCYAEEHDLTTGSTASLFDTPATDIGFWHENLKESMDELGKITDSTPQLEKTNVLIKLRETLLDHHSGGESVTCPDSIYLHPHNVAYFWGVTGGMVGAILGVVFVIGFFAVNDNR